MKTYKVIRLNKEGNVIGSSGGLTKEQIKKTEDITDEEFNYWLTQKTLIVDNYFDYKVEEEK